MSDNKLSWS